jgi:hypothetical protein
MGPNYVIRTIPGSVIRDVPEPVIPDIPGDVIRDVPGDVIHDVPGVRYSRHPRGCHPALQTGDSSRSPIVFC